MSPRARLASFRSSFQFKLFSIFTLLTFLTICLLTTLYVITEVRQTRDQAHQQLKLQSLRFADSIRLSLYAENLSVLGQIAAQELRTPEIIAVLISASDGRALVDIHKENSSTPTKSISQSVEIKANLLADSVESALTDVKEKHPAVLGTVSLERGTSDITEAVYKVIWFSVLVGMIFWLGVSILSYLVLCRVTDSFNDLVHGINLLKGGDLTFRIKINSNDEASRASDAVNNLAIALQKSGEENFLLNEERLEFERKMLQSQKLESLGIMAGGIAHDFNNLLQSILGNLELAGKELAQNSDSQKHIANAMKSGKAATHLTNLMLTYVGKGLISKRELDLNEVVRGNAEMLRSATSESVSIELQLSEELPCIKADDAQIQQLVMNLITNAAESIEKMLGLVRLSTGILYCDQAFLATSLLTEKPEPGNYVFLEVSDNGCGMSAETLKRLFDPFFTTKFTGRGLGMSAVIGIVRSHNGALCVESEPGRGTTFKVLFPISEKEQSDTTQPQETNVSPEKNEATGELFSGLALVVDDEKSVLKVCTKMIKLLGFKVITASDGIEAVSKFREHADDIAVVLMDLTMPDMDGITAMHEIYRIKPDTKVILASGFNRDDLTESITDQAACGFIRKPYSMGALEAEIRRVIQGDGRLARFQ
jgi:signal transduction histidine kinase